MAVVTLAHVIGALLLISSVENGHVYRCAQRNGVKLVVVVPRGNIVGNAVVVEVRCMNKSSEPIFYHYTTRYRTLGLDLKDGSGNAVAMTRFGMRAIGKDIVRFGGSHQFRRVVPGGHSILRLNLTKLFDLSLDGKYKLTVELEINPGLEKGSFTLAVKDVPVNVGDDEP